MLEFHLVSGSFLLYSSGFLSLSTISLHQLHYLPQQKHRLIFPFDFITNHQSPFPFRTNPSRFGELVRLDIPPPREDGQKYAFVEYKNPEDCEKALELDGKTLEFSNKEGLTVQMARLDPNLRRNRNRQYRGGYERGPPYGYGGGYGYGPGPRGGRGGGYGYSYGYDHGPGGYGPDPYLHGYPPYSNYGRGGRGGRDRDSRDRDGRDGRDRDSRDGRDRDSRPYMQYGVPPGGYAPPYPRDYDSYGYRGLYDDYPRERYLDRERGDRGRDYRDRDGRDNRDRERRPRDRDAEPVDDAELKGEPAEYDRGRYPRAESPRDKNRSRSPSR